MSNPTSHFPTTDTESNKLNLSSAGVSVAPGNTDSDAYSGAYTSSLANAQPPVGHHHVHREDEPLQGGLGSESTGQSPFGVNASGLADSDTQGAYSSGFSNDQPPVGRHHVHREDEPFQGGLGSESTGQSPFGVNASGLADSDTQGAYSSGFSNDQPPVGRHHVHREDEPLPGAQGSAPTVDYSSNAMRSAVLPPSEVGDSQDFHPTGGPHHHSSHHSHHDHGADHHHTTDHSVQPFEKNTLGGSSSPGIKTTPLPPVPGYAGTTENREYNTSSLQSPEYDADGTALGDNNYNNQSTGKVGTGDKTIGKTQQAAGKVTGNTGLKEKGEANASSQPSAEYDTSTYDKPTGEKNFDHPTGKANTSSEKNDEYDIDGKRSGEKNFNQPTGKVSLGDKVLGKTEKIAGKLTGNTDLQEKGEARVQGLN